MSRALKPSTLALALVVGSALAALAQPLAAVPDHLAGYYGQNQALIGQLTKAATDPAAPDRLAAFEQLSAQFPLAAGETARVLIKDQSLELAREAAAFLAGTLAMADHGRSPTSAPAAHDVHSERGELARAALRDAIDDNRPEIRAVAATVLATIGDVPGLNRIASAVESGRIPEEHAASYYAQGPSPTNSPYLARFLDKGSLPARARAVAYLAGEPSHQQFIKNQIFLNEAAPEQVRAAAASALGRTDPQFSSYALPVASNPSVPADVFKSIMLTSVQNAPRTDTAQLKAIQQSIENFEKARPNVDLGGLKQQLRIKAPTL